jgi:hypothetical protein
MWELSGWAKAGVILVDKPLPPVNGWSDDRKELIGIVEELSEENVSTLLRIAQLMATEGFSYHSRTARRKQKPDQ